MLTLFILSGKKNGVETSERNLLHYIFKIYVKKYSPLTIDDHFGKLKRMVKKHENIDISEYFILNATISKKVFPSKKSLVFKTEQLKKFLKEAPEPEFLLHKVTYFMIY